MSDDLASQPCCQGCAGLCDHLGQVRAGVAAAVEQRRRAERLLEGAAQASHGGIDAGAGEPGDLSNLGRGEASPQRQVEQCVVARALAASSLPGPFQRFEIGVIVRDQGLGQARVERRDGLTGGSATCTATTLAHVGEGLLQRDAEQPGTERQRGWTLCSFGAQTLEGRLSSGSSQGRIQAGAQAEVIDAIGVAVEQGLAGGVITAGDQVS
jgi:hypothetical protein